MSIFIHSDDFTSGNSSDGVWDLGRNLKGTWTVTGQSMDTQTYPWMFEGQDTMIFRIHEDRAAGVTYVTFPVTFDPALGLLTDPYAIVAAIGTAIQDRIDAAAMGEAYAATTVTTSVDTSAKTITLHFDGAVDVLWTYNSIDYVSTFNPAVGKTGAPDQLAITDLVFSYQRMTTSPKYLFVYISESTSELITTSGSLPTLLFSTKDTEYTGQVVTIRADTSILTLKICRMHETVAVPISGEWFLVLKKIG